MAHADLQKSTAASRYERGLRSQEVGDHEDALFEFTKSIFLNPDEPAYYKARADTYLYMCDFKSAASNYRKAVMLAPDDHKARRVLAGILDALGHRRLESKQYHAAISMLSEAITLDGFRANFYLHRALAYIALKQWASALHDADCSVRVDSTHCDAFILRAKLHWKVGNQKEGNEDFKRAHKLNPNHIEVKKFEQKMWDQAEQAYQAASSFLLRNDFDKAIELLSNALELNPGDVKVLVLRASAFRHKSQFQQALEDLEEAREIYCYSQDPMRKIAQQPDQPEEGVFEHPEITRQRNLTLNDMAVEKFQHKLYQEAITLFNKVIVAETQSARMYDGAVIDARFFVNRGDCYRMIYSETQDTDRLSLALADYHSAHELLPTSWDVITRLSLVRHAFGIKLFNEGKFLEAEVEFTAAIKHNPKVATYYAHRGNALYYQMNLSQAHKDYLKALELDPNNADVKARLSQYKAPVTAPGLASKGKVESLANGPTIKISANPPKPSSTMLSADFADAQIAERQYLATNRKVHEMYTDRIKIDESMTLDPKKSKKENASAWKNVSDYD